MYRHEYRRFIRYFLSGVVTTVLNFAVYFQTVNYLSPVISTVLAWIISVFAAYILNSRMVFSIENYRFLQEIGCFFRFLLSRLFSGLVEVVVVFIFIEKLRLWDLAVKGAVCLLVIILNYILSKTVVFRKGVKENAG